MQIVGVSAAGSNYQYRWPSGNVESFPSWLEYRVRAEDGQHILRIGFTRRSVYGSDRARVVIWIDDHPHAEFVGADDFDFSGEVLSEIKVPGEVGERICRYPDEPIPERYAAFNTAGLPTRIQAQGVHGAWAVVANLCDHKTMTALTAPQFLEYSKEGAKLVNRSKVSV